MSETKKGLRDMSETKKGLRDMSETKKEPINEHEKLTIAIQALKDIVDPISALRRELKNDEILNGSVAISLSNDQSHLKNIAKEALSKIK